MICFPNCCSPVIPSLHPVHSASQRLRQASHASQIYSQRTAIKFEPAFITFENVDYSVPLPPVRRRGVDCHLQLRA